MPLRDKRTCLELVKNGHEAFKPAKQLLGRVQNLFKLEIRRATMDHAIRHLSRGADLSATCFQPASGYWMTFGDEAPAVYMCIGTVSEDLQQHRCIHVDSGCSRDISIEREETLSVQEYVPVTLTLLIWFQFRSA